MRIDGRWMLCADGIERPVVDAELLLPTRQLVAVTFLLDTGADMTVVSYDVAQALSSYLQQSTTTTTGIGGTATASLLNAAIVFTALDGSRSGFNGPLPAFASRQITLKGANQTLADVSLSSAAVLRCLLYNDPVAKFVLDVLSDIGRDIPVSMHSLVLLSAERDKTITPLIFFNPEMVAEITDDYGQLTWHRIQSHHFRSTMFLQYKSILKHAGVIKPYRLGGSSAKSYKPDNDIWELMI